MAPDNRSCWEKARTGYYRDKPLGEFKVDALAHVGLTGHQKGEKAFTLAWDLASSYHGVGAHLQALIHLKSLADLLLTDWCPAIMPWRIDSEWEQEHVRVGCGRCPGRPLARLPLRPGIHSGVLRRVAAGTMAAHEGRLAAMSEGECAPRLVA